MVAETDGGGRTGDLKANHTAVLGLRFATLPYKWENNWVSGHVKLIGGSGQSRTLLEYQQSRLRCVVVKDDGPAREFAA